MLPEITKLANGIRVVSCAMPHVETVSLGLWVGVGARHEEAHENGLSHLLEHMAFKGTASRSAQRIAEEIEEVGGELNAATGLDSTAYYARVLKGDDKVALTILADILLSSSFDANELDKEREVILQEIAGAKDSPEDLAYELLQQTAYPGQAIGRPILGTPESVKAITAAHLRDFLARKYRPEVMVFSAAGAIDHEKWVRHVEALFGGLTHLAQGEEAPAVYTGGLAASEKPFEQSHLLIGYPAPSFLDDAYMTAQVFSGLFGGGMSSRLFQEVRERRGLCYAIYSSVWGLRDTGMLAVHAATGPRMVDELAGVVADELVGLARQGPNASEMQRSKAQLKAGLLMALESSTVRAEQMARHLMGHDRLISPAELTEHVDAVTVESVEAFARGLLVAKPTIALVGSGRKSKVQAKSAAAALAGHAAMGV
ncbi:MAG: pitrilysin family protein [Hyphomicrobium sp.]